MCFHFAILSHICYRFCFLLNIFWFLWPTSPPLGLCACVTCICRPFCPSPAWIRVFCCGGSEALQSVQSCGSLIKADAATEARQPLGQRSPRNHRHKQVASHCAETGWKGKSPPPAFPSPTLLNLSSSPTRPFLPSFSPFPPPLRSPSFVFSEQKRPPPHIHPLNDMGEEE